MFNAYRDTVGGRPCTMEEVSEWALANGFYPVPSIRDDAEKCAAWDLRFVEVTGKEVTAYGRQ